MRKNFDSNIFIFVLFISYFIFLLTNGIANLKYSGRRELNFIENKLSEIEDKYYYLQENVDLKNIEENNREMLYLEEMKDEILENLKIEGEFWLVDLKNLIKQKENLLSKNFFEGDFKKYTDLNYLKIKNEIDEYNFYYNLKQKPIDYVESTFMKYFTFIFNSKIHQFFLTILVLSVSLFMIKNNNCKYTGFLRISMVIIFCVFVTQILNLIIWMIVDKKFDIFYPVRIIENFNIKYILDLEGVISDRIIPFYKIILYTFLIEFMYIIFIVAFIKVVDLIFEFRHLKIAILFTFFISMVGLEFTRYSGISFFSYGKFFDVIRGYESIYKSNEFFNIYIFLMYLLIVMIVFIFVYLYKKYILNDKYI